MQKTRKWRPSSLEVPELNWDNGQGWLGHWCSGRWCRSAVPISHKGVKLHASVSEVGIRCRWRSSLIWLNDLRSRKRSSRVEVAAGHAQGMRNRDSGTDRLVGNMAFDLSGYPTHIKGTTQDTPTKRHIPPLLTETANSTTRIAWNKAGSVTVSNYGVLRFRPRRQHRTKRWTSLCRSCQVIRIQAIDEMCRFRRSK